MQPRAGRAARAALLLLALTFAPATAAAIASAASAQTLPLAGAAIVPAAVPSPAAPLQAFLLASAPDSLADLQAHASAIDVVYPTYFECALPGGEVVGAANAEVDAYTAVHGIAELPRFTCQDGATVHRILTRPALRARVLDRLVALAASPAYAGINLDLENDGVRDRGALNSFTDALAHRLHAVHRQLAVDVVGVTHETLPRPAAGFYDDRYLATVADTVFVMAWGPHWEGSAPGPIAPLAFVRSVASYVSSLPYPRRFVLGVPMYGLNWPLGGGHMRAVALQYAQIVALAGSADVVPARASASDEMTFAYAADGRAHRVWYLDASAIAERIAIARRYGLAAGVWRLGSEDQELWAN